MRPNFIIRTFVFLTVLYIVGTTDGMVQTATDEHQRMLPAETVIAASFKKVNGSGDGKSPASSSPASSNWQNSGLSKLLNHPSLVSFFGDLQKTARASRKAKPFAKVDFRGLWKVIDGRVTFAWLPYNNQLQLIVIADVGSNEAAAKKWLHELESNLGSNYRVNPRSKTGVVSYRIPNANKPNRVDTQFAHTLQGGKLFVASSESQLQSALKRLAIKQRSLAQDPFYKATTSSVQASQKQDSIWWFLRPIELGRNATKNTKSIEGEFSSADFFRLAPIEGYDAIRAAGGTGLITPDGSLNLVAKINARRPFKNSMRLLNLPNQKMFRLPDWAGDEASSATLVSLHFNKMLGHFATLFDQLYGEGESGVFELVLDDIQNDPKGPRVNMQNEVFAKLQDTLSVTTIKKSPTKVARVFAAAVKDSNEIAHAIDRLYRGDAAATRINSAQYPAWLVKPLKNDPAGGRRRAAYVIAVRNNYVLIGPSLDDVEACFQISAGQIDESDTYKEFVSFARQQLGDELCMMSYGRFDRWVERKTAEIRSGSVTGVAGIIFEQLGWNAILPSVKTNLPQFETLQKFCNGNLGIAGSATSDGWNIVVRLKTD